MIKGILQSLRDGAPINVNEGSFGIPGQSGVSVTWDKLMDLRRLATNAMTMVYFDGNNSDEALCNVPNGLVPGGERWDLYGLEWYFRPSGGTSTPAVWAAFCAFINSGFNIISLGQTQIRNQPLAGYFGNRATDVLYVSTTTAVNPSSPQSTWRDIWPEEAFLTVSSTVKMTFKVQLTAGVDVNLNNLVFGASFMRARAAKTAG